MDTNTTNSVTNYLFEKVLEKHDASKEKDITISKMDEQINHLQSMLQKEAKRSDSLCDEIVRIDIALLNSQRMVIEQEGKMTEDTKVISDLTLQVNNGLAAQDELERKYARLVDDFGKLVVNYLRLALN